MDFFVWAGNVVGFSEASDVISVDLSSQEGTDIQIARLATFFNNLTVFENRPKSRIQLWSEASNVYIVD